MKGRRRRRADSPGRQKHQLGRDMTPALIHSLNHPIRRQILRLLNEPGVELSPNEMTRSMEAGLSVLSFHMRVLSEQRVTRCSRERRVRGSTEHFYKSNVADNELVGAILQNTERDDRFLHQKGKGE